MSLGEFARANGVNAQRLKWWRKADGSWLCLAKRSSAPRVCRRWQMAGHRAGFRLFWRWKSRARTPSDGEVTQETKRLIRQMAKANAGAPRYQRLVA